MRSAAIFVAGLSLLSALACSTPATTPLVPGKWYPLVNGLVPARMTMQTAWDFPKNPLTDRRQPLTQAQLESGRIHLQGTAQRIGIQDAFAGFGLQPKVPSDARIARVVQEVERRPDAFGRIQEAAELACLSPSRFRARFDAEVGLPFRRYRLWRRMALVMRAIAEGKSLTAAALEAGFSSSAHLSSSFKRMFGLSASEVIALGVAIDVSEDRVLSTASAAQADSEGRHALAL